ncbi:JAB domain-containing protein [Paenibacillus sp. NPDC055715]
MAGKRSVPKLASIDELLLLSEQPSESPDLKVEQLNAFLRSHRVLQWEEENAKQSLSTPEKASRYFSSFLGGIKDREQFMVAFLDIKNQVIETRIISEGGISETVVHPRNVLKAALNCDCSSIILAHNHPSAWLLSLTRSTLACWIISSSAVRILLPWLNWDKCPV